MIYRDGFVANSSSTGYVVTNTSSEVKTLIDFAKENKHLVDDYISSYGKRRDNSAEDMKKNVIRDAASRDTIWEPGESKNVSFGDEDGDTLGVVYDYCLRDGGSSENFSWHYGESLR